MGVRGDAFEMINTSNFQQRTIGSSKYTVEPLNCMHVRHPSTENFVFQITQVIPAHNYGEHFRFVEGCLYVLPPCYPIVDYAMMCQGNLILFQVSVMSLADHQEKRRKNIKKLSDLTNDVLEKILSVFGITLPKKSKDNYVDAIQKNSYAEALANEGRKISMKEYIQVVHQITLGDTSLVFWDLLWSTQQIGPKLWINAFGTQTPLDKSKVFLLYITTSNEIPRDRKIDENNNHVMVVPGKKLDSLLLNQYLNIINHVSGQNEWKFTSEELELCK